LRIRYNQIRDRIIALQHEIDGITAEAVDFADFARGLAGCNSPEVNGA
jgi:hypothetical protein